MNNQQMPTRVIQVKREDLQMMKCSNPDCDSTIFTQIFELGILPAVVSPNGQAQTITFPRMICIKCGSDPVVEDQNNVKGSDIKESKQTIIH